jgi:hypothetical protein
MDGATITRMIDRGGEIKRPLEPVLRFDANAPCSRVSSRRCSDRRRCRAALDRRSSSLRRALQSHAGSTRVAAFYGPSIWLVMSLAVIPLLVHRPPSISGRWWIQLLGQIRFVGLPIVISIARGVAESPSLRK